MVADPIPASAPAVLTTAELCRRWRCTPRTLERMARDGRIHRLKLRGGVRYPLDEVYRLERGASDSAPTRPGPTDPDGIGKASAGTAPDLAIALSPQAPDGRLATDGPSTSEAGRLAAGVDASTPADRAANGPILAVQGEPALPAGPLVPALPPVEARTWYSVCVAHRKGGVAKSTTTWYLARELARAGKRVVLRDLDPQQGLRDILRDHGCEDGRYSRAIALVEDGARLPFRPDVELIDTPPALDDSLPGVARADAIIVPAMPEHQAVRALERMLLVLQDTGRAHPFVRVLGILPVRVKPRWSEHAAFLGQIQTLAEQFGHPVLPAIPESRAVLTYSLRGRLWRPVAEVVLAAMAREVGTRVAANDRPTNVSGTDDLAAGSLGHGGDGTADSLAMSGIAAPLAEAATVGRAEV